MQIAKFLHAAVLVSELERSEYFYGSILGLEKIDRILKYPGAWYRVGDFQIHLIVDRAALPGTIQNTEKLGRNRHIALSVTDLEVAKTRLLEGGFSVQMSASGRAALFVRDPDGNVIELAQSN